jgi:hypothetical protein
MAIGTTVPGLRSSRSELVGYAERPCMKVRGRFVMLTSSIAASANQADEGAAIGIIPSGAMTPTSMLGLLAPLATHEGKAGFHEIDVFCALRATCAQEDWLDTRHHRPRAFSRT